MWTIQGTAAISKDATLEMDVPVGSGISPGAYEARILFKKRPHSLSPADFDVESMLKSPERIDWGEHPVIALSEGQVIVTADGRITFRMAFGTQPGNYPITLQLYVSLAEMLQHPIPYDEL